MTREEFVRERQESWDALETLLAELERSGARSGASAERVFEFSRRYRALCHDLAQVRTHDFGDDLELRLNALAMRGHHVLYRKRSARAGHLLAFLLGGFPALLRNYGRYFALACAVFLLPALVTGVLSYHDHDFARRVLPSAMIHQFQEMYAEAPDDGTGREASAAGFYVKHNVAIAFRCFAFGMLFGLGSLYILFVNGVAIGTIFGMLCASGRGMHLTTFVITHGAFELTAIVIAGTAGLVLGDALLRPGKGGRIRALQERGLDAVRLAGGAAFLLVLAAVIEGFWSPSIAPGWLKLSVGAACWILVASYLALAGRRVAR